MVSLLLNNKNKTKVSNFFVVLIRKKGRSAEIVLLDHGLYQKLEEKERIALSHTWKAIVLNDHENMKKYGNELGIKDYRMFAEILTQAPLKSSEFKLKIRLSDEDLKKITEFAQKRFDQIMETLKDMPRSLLLVVRNLNTIRAICRAHGDPINRYEILARSATKTAFDEITSIKKLKSIPIKIYFETMLLYVFVINSWYKLNFDYFSFQY